MWQVTRPLHENEVCGDLDIIETKNRLEFVYQKQKGLYQNKVTFSLTPTQRLGI